MKRSFEKWLIVIVAIGIFHPVTFAAAGASFERFQEADDLSEKIETLSRAGKYDEAIIHAIKLLESQTDARSKAKTLNSLAMLYLGKGLYDESESLLKSAMNLQEESVGVNHPDFALSLQNLGALYLQWGRYAEVEAPVKRSMIILEKALGKYHPFLANNLYNLGLLSREMGRYSEVVPLFERALLMKEKILGAAHPDVAAIIGALASLHREQGRYEESETLYKKAFAIQEKTLEADHPDRVALLAGMATLYAETARYRDAEMMLTKGLALLEARLGKDHPSVATTLQHLGNLYQTTGRYADAEPLYLRALAIDKISSGEDPPRTAMDLQNLADLYIMTGRSVEAEKLLKKVLAIREDKLGQNHPLTANTCFSLAMIYRNMNRHDDAEVLLKRVIAMRTRSFGREHPGVANALNALAVVCRENGRYEEALRHLTEARFINEKIMGPEHPDVAVNLNNLGDVHASMGKIAEADADYRKALEIEEKTLGPEHPFMATTVLALAVNDAGRDRQRNSHEWFVRGDDIRRKVRDATFTLLSEPQKLRFMERQQGFVFSYISHTLDYLDSDPKAVQDTLNTWLRWKGAVLEAQGRYMEGLHASTDKAVQEKFSELRLARENLARLYLYGPAMMSPGVFRKRIKELSARIESLESELIRASKRFAVERNAGMLDAKGISAALPGDAVYLDYADIYQYDFKMNRWGKARYAVFVLNPGREPKIQLMDLGEREVIDRLILDYREEIKQALDKERLPNSRKLNNLAQSLYKLVLLPLEKQLQGKKKIFLSPDGLLNLMPFEVLVTPSGKFLVEDFFLYYLTSGKDLTRFEENNSSSKNALIIADPDYDLGDEERVPQAAAPDLDNAPIRGGIPSRAKEIHFQRLPDTKREADGIDGILTQAFGMNVKNYQGTQALEEMLFKRTSSGIIHLATHGFFLESEKVSPKRHQGLLGYAGDLSGIDTSDNPFLQSGFALAGVNRSLQKESDKGLVTAEKILGLDLKMTDLVVLSACETGVGMVKSGEGVFGLKRAFILTGAKTLLLSLWTVPSAETAELMIDFYTTLAKGRTKGDALREAKMRLMRKKGNPFFWGAFIMVGNPE